MVRTRSSIAATGPWALFDALARGNDLLATQLLHEGPGADQLLHEGPGAVTSLHLAVAARCHGALPLLLAAVGGTGLLNQPLDSYCWEEEEEEEGGGLKEFLLARGCPESAIDRQEPKSVAFPLCACYTPLAVACGMRPPNARVIRLLLEAGADPHGWTDPQGGPSSRYYNTMPINVLNSTAYCSNDRSCIPAARALLAGGADPLSAPVRGAPDGTLRFLECEGSTQRYVACLIQHMERHLAAGTLQLRSSHEAQQLISIASQRAHEPLALHALRWLRSDMRSRYVFPRDKANVRLFTGLVEDAVHGGSPTVLRELLGMADVLPFDMEKRLSGRSLIDQALDRHLVNHNASDSDSDEEADEEADEEEEEEEEEQVEEDEEQEEDPAALTEGGSSSGRGPDRCIQMLRMLHAAGAPVDFHTLLTACESLWPELVDAVLACGRPQAPHGLTHGFGNCGFAYPCPIHTTLMTLDVFEEHASREAEQGAVAILESLRAAGYRPTVFHLSVPAAGLGVGREPRQVLDLFIDGYSPTLSSRALFIAKGGCWSPAEHHRWPEGFKAAVRALLLGASGAGGGSKANTLLAVLPLGVLLQIITFAASPMLGWD